MIRLVLLIAVLCISGTKAFCLTPEEELSRLKKSESHYWNEKDWGNHLLVCHEILANYSEYLSSREKANWNIKLAGTLKELGSYLLSVEYLNEAFKFEMNDDDRAYAHGQLAGDYIELGEFDKAISQFLMAQAFLALNDRKIQSINSLGYTYFLAGRFEEARSSYMDALELFSAAGQDSIQYMIVQSNLASLDFEQGNNSSGLSRLKELEILLSKGHDWFAREVYTKLSTYYLEVGNCQESFRTLSILRSLIPENEVSADLLRYIGNKLKQSNSCLSPDSSQYYFERYIEIEEVLRSDQQLSLMAVEKLQRDEFKKRLALLSVNIDLKRESERRYRNIMILSAVLIFVLLIAAIVWFRATRTKQGRKEEYLELREKLVNETEMSNHLKTQMEEKELQNKKLELMQVLNSANNEATLFEEIKKRLKVLGAKEGDVKEDVIQLLHFLSSHENQKAVNVVIEENIELIGGDFKERFFGVYSNLTTSEQQLVLLIRIGLATKEMALMRNVEPSSIRIFKHRLKAKLKLDKKSDLAKFIQSF